MVVEKERPDDVWRGHDGQVWVGYSGHFINHDAHGFVRSTRQVNGSEGLRGFAKRRLQKLNGSRPRPSTYR